MSLHLYLIRHGETEWSISGQHTGRTDIPLTPHGEDEARENAPRLRDIPFVKVLTSPLQCAEHFPLATASLGIFGLGAHHPEVPEIAP